MGIGIGGFARFMLYVARKESGDSGWVEHSDTYRDCGKMPAIFSMTVVECADRALSSLMGKKGEVVMVKVNVAQIDGNWDLGFSLDKHTISSTYLGDDEYGHPRFDTVRSEVGEALFQLKYRSDKSQVPLLGQQMYVSLGCHLRTIGVVIPMPPSKSRQVQPVTEIARDLATRLGLPYTENLLIKTAQTPQMKDIADRDDRVAALCAAFTVYDVLPEGKHDVLIVDDLFDTGSSLEAATMKLRQYDKIAKVLVATVTRKHL